ncbi:MAG TPA: glycosyltransferase family 2 protein [Nitrospirales bacterium]|nr:glycosyltransferase family 2 protein [Nitrospirales bacterium]HIB54816.1 glycosyltransferase family 2 protein [Nitrospirales bacterium]HIO20779.1 glycosyltransferase family 2 protein [Nitrospirales bacterium]
MKKPIPLIDSAKLPISVYLLTYNEEVNIRAALESVTWADEIIVVDSFSSDKTEQICREFTNLFFQHKFEGFGQLRNQAISHTTYDWILSVDADERVSNELREEITMLVQRGPSADAFYVPRKSHFLGQWIRYGGWYPDYRQPQFFHRLRMRYREDMVHESFEFMNGAEGKLEYLQGHVFQYPFRTISHYLGKMHRYSTLRAEAMYREGRRFRTHQLVTHPLFTFFKMYIVRQGFRDGMAGLVLAGLYASYVFTKYAKLWEHYDRVSQ